MSTWKEHIERLKRDWIGKKVMYGDRVHTIVDVDINGILHIDLPSEHNMTTAVFDEIDVKEALI
jgi:hypothetical protein